MPDLCGLCSSCDWVMLVLSGFLNQLLLCENILHLGILLNPLHCLLHWLSTIELHHVFYFRLLSVGPCSGQLDQHGPPMRQEV